MKDGRPEDEKRRPRLAADSAKLREEAAAWVSLLSSGIATQADAEALKRWCRKDPAHAEAYAVVVRTWELLKPVAGQAKHAPVAVPRAVLTRRLVLGGSAAAAAACVAYSMVRPPLGLWPSLAELGADVRTATGEQRHLALAQGFAVDLNTRSSLALRSSANNARHVELINGEAVVAAGPEAGGSCLVTAGAGLIVARNARFAVRRDGERQVRVVCLDGRIEVQHPAQRIELGANERVAYDQDGMSGKETADAALVTSWQQGRLVFRQAPLSEVIAEVNRYRPGLIVLMDGALGHRLVDASFKLDRLDTVIVYVQQAFEVPVRRLPGDVVLLG